MLNFGALIAFMGVNAAAFLRYYWRAEEKKAGHLIPPVLGFIICLLLWMHLSHPAMKLGAIWMAAASPLVCGGPGVSPSNSRSRFPPRSESRGLPRCN